MDDRAKAELMSATESEQVSGGIWKKNGVIPGYQAPTVLYDDGINVQTTDPTTSNV
jgi:hypothetical protein